MILVDTSVWSLALRRRRGDLNPAERGLAFELRERVIDGAAAIIGPIRQEVLSGVAVADEYRVLKARLAAVADLPLELSMWELAAEYYNICRAAGIAPDSVDMTICAAAHTHSCSIFTTDPDFARYARVLPIHLYAP
jgi:predicted nucleic acid-binding protein